ncbi:thioredoxin domain-containing protein [Psychroserpens damuponensis]|uniref:hypothetical protein n=1 Tax=Psychroserpens damuponensis TaxID=943936 RepID=UPI00126A7A54|nr:hypothetical protein [Psychroserpens damuponensis]
MSSNKHVKLVEKKTGKRLQLFAENTDSIPYMVFLRVTTTDFRRTSKRPVLKEIPGHTKLLLKTLILLDGKEGIYDASFIVNEVTTNLAIRKSKEFDTSISDAKLNKNVTIYTHTDCNLCNEGLVILEENAFNYKSYDVITHPEVLDLLTYEVGGSKSIEALKFPVLKIEGSIYTSIKTRQEFIDILKTHFE